MTLTPEQETIIATEVPRGELLKITAFAGCAKTTTLREYTKARPDKKFLYLAFNTSVAAEAKDTFPFNVECKTTHSLAFRKFGFPYKTKLGYLKPFVLTENLGVSSYPVAKYLIDVVTKYLASADAEIMEKHLILDREKSEEQFRLEKDPDRIAYLLKKANELWEAMKDPKNLKVSMLHDGYLKMFQLSKPQLPYDYVLLDEAHDTNDVTLDIFLNQECAKILVGDSHQSIYEFRHAYDAIGTTSANINKYLSTSFRFGSSIADTANRLLSTLKKETKPIQGFQPLDEVGRINISKPFTVVSRTNGELFGFAATQIMSHHAPKFGFVGTVDRDNYSPLKHYHFDRILDVYYLYSEQKSRIKDPYIKRFFDFVQFMQVVNDKDAPDIELRSRANVVKKYKGDIPELVKAICRNSYKPSEAHITFTTAHRSKGLEWDQVLLTNDYEDLIIEDDEKGASLVTEDDLNPQEINLLYVAATRAKKTLQLNKSLLDLQTFLDKP